MQTIRHDQISHPIDFEPSGLSQTSKIHFFIALEFIYYSYYSFTFYNSFFKLIRPK